MKIDDETFYLQGESTLLSLRNGGGKSVLVQMLMAPFMSKGKRHLKDRQFESYFTTNRPTFILIEWVKDHGAGYVLTGMMVRKRQENLEEMEREPLEVLQFIHEYNAPNDYDINHFPAVEVTEKGKKLKSFGSMRQLFEELKKQNHYQFSYYDMSQSHQARRYFSHLKENQIHQKEWESIIKPINLKESGLSELFNDAKNAQGLVEKWFLHAVHDKLNKEDDKIKRFRENLMKYIHQYKSNRSKITRKALIEMFNEEAKDLFAAAYAFKETKEEKENLEVRIASLKELLAERIEVLVNHIVAEADMAENIRTTISTLQYEALCIEIYKVLDRQETLNLQIEANQEAVKAKEDEKQAVLTSIHCGECAKLYEAYQKTSKEVQKYENDLEILSKKSEDLAPRRQNLGYTLRRYYEGQKSFYEGKKEALEAQIVANGKAKEQLEEAAKLNRQKSNELQKKQGSCEAYVKSYDAKEKQYNQKYKTNLCRNIVGYYEDQLLYKQKEALMTAQGALQRDGLHLKNKMQAHTEEIQGQNAKEREINHLLIETRQELKQQEKVLEDLKQEMIARQEIIKYVGLGEADLFDEPKILVTFEKYIQELTQKKLEYQLLYEKEKEAYEALKSGKVLKLPVALEEAIEALGINLMYGMEWLKKNGYSEEMNKKLVKANPFIPYALIMTQKEILHLRQSQLGLYTQTPIPIIKREALESAEAPVEDLQVQVFDKVSFLVAFNEGLLNEETLGQMLAHQEKQIEEIAQNLKKRQEEIAFYEDKKNKIAYSQLSKKNYDAVVSKVEALNEINTKGQADYDRCKMMLNQLKESLGTLQKSLQDVDKQFIQVQNQLEDLETLANDYCVYTERKEELLQSEKSLKALEAIIDDENNRRNKLYEAERELGKESLNISSALEQTKEQLLHYGMYLEGEQVAKDIEDIEAEYKSITENISLDQKNLETLLENAKQGFKQQEEELIEKAQEYALEEERYRNIKYSRFEEKQQKAKVKVLETDIKTLMKKFAELREKNGELKNKLESLEDKLRKEFHKELMPREALVVVDFETQMMMQEMKLKTVLQNKLQHEEEKRIFEVQLSGLDGFAERVIEEKVLIAFTKENIETIKKELLRDYQLSIKTCDAKHKQLSKVISEMQRQEAFEDEFFKGPLMTLEKIAEHPDFVIENLNNTLAAYATLMIKLEADIALIEKEKQSLLDSIMQYIYEIHEHIGKIDRNSTVTIHEKPIKMLKIDLPNWEEQEGLYEIRLKDLVESITNEALSKLEQNETIEELVGKRVTTKNLYNEVVGISQIGVKLYKVEEEKVYQISWDEVAKNSGGEGFLSAFVVLSSLLSYMRRDENDLWGEYESGKVLVMDNPFAQTNAAHLLKPLMDMANKRNTQLICLSGLNGESIYNRFDNIYVLNLIASRLNEGTKYLRSDHIRGPEAPQELVGVQIQTEVIDQMTLF